MKIMQQTIKNAVTISGIGQHKGTENTIVIEPAPVDSGIIFEVNGKRYPFGAEYVYGETGCSCIGIKDGDNVKIVEYLIEHLVSTLHGVGIDNAIIKTETTEIPILDGSAKQFVEILREKAGFLQQDTPRKYIKILRKVSYTDDKGDVSIDANTKDVLTLDVTIDYAKIKPIGIENAVVDLTPEIYIEKICKARTFARLSDVEYLHSKGLCLGATLNSGIAVDEEKVINPEGLRFENEFVYHKILDAVGDLYVMGHPVIGYYKNNRGGHFHNNQLVRAVMADSKNYEIVELEQREQK